MKNLSPKTSFVLGALLLVSACGTPSGQNQYTSDEVGISTIVEFGTILDVREIGITGKSTGTGALAGGALGAAGASGIGGGSGQAVAVVGGAIVGAVAGAVIERSMIDGKGIEYTIIKENGKPITIAQNLNKGDAILQKGERVIIQTSGSYQRVLSANHLPEAVNRPVGMKVVDPAQ